MPTSSHKAPLTVSRAALCCRSVREFLFSSWGTRRLKIEDLSELWCKIRVLSCCTQILCTFFKRSYCCAHLLHFVMTERDVIYMHLHISSNNKRFFWLNLAFETMFNRVLQSAMDDLHLNWFPVKKEVILNTVCKYCVVHRPLWNESPLHAH